MLELVSPAQVKAQSKTKKIIAKPTATSKADLQLAAATALEQHKPGLQENFEYWPQDACEETCNRIFSDLKNLLRGAYDLRGLQLCSGLFDTIEISDNDSTSQYGNHWERGHDWIEWRGIIIDPTASQFLDYLPDALLVATPDMVEHSFYCRKPASYVYDH